MLSNNTSSRICQELLTNSLSPCISIASSQSADKFAERLNFDSFYHLIRPFGLNLASNFNIKNTQLITNSYKNFSVRFSMATIDVLQFQNQLPDKHQIFHISDVNKVLNQHFESCNVTDLEQLKANNNELIQRLYIKLFATVHANHMILPFETFNHPIIHLVVLTSSDLPESINAILAANCLNRKKYLTPGDENTQSSVSSTVPNYLNLSGDEDSLICFLILIDSKVPEDEAKCTALKDFVKKTFYYPCLTLKLGQVDANGTSETSPAPAADPIEPTLYKSVFEELQAGDLAAQKHTQTQTQTRTQTLSHDDAASIHTTLVELVKLNLIPFMEKKISYWDDIYVQPRKSITNRFFSVSKRYFSASGNSKTAVTESLVDPITGCYSHSAPEAIIRKLADWAFMLKDYKYAHQTYELLKKDFNNEKSWAYFASCQEMSVLSQLLDLISCQTSSSSGYYNSIKSKIPQIVQTIDSANYTFVSRCGLKSHSLKFQLAVSELFSCLKINTFSEANVSVALSSSTTSHLFYNNVYAIKYLSDIITLKFLSYTLVDAQNNVVSDEKSYMLLKALVLQRISYCYALYLYNHSKYSIIVDTGLVSAQDELSHKFSEKPNLALLGLTRYRKSEFWELLADKQWNRLLNGQ